MSLERGIGCNTPGRFWAARDRRRRRLWIQLPVLALIAFLGCCSSHQPGSCATELFVEALEHYTGQAGECDFAEAERKFKEAAESGDPRGKLMYARINLDGLVLDLSDEDAAQLWRDALGAVRKLSDGGEPYAMSVVGAYDYSKKGTELLLRAARAGVVFAEAALPVRFEAGVGVPEDAAKAFQYAKVAAESGDARAALTLARYYRAGTGTEKDPQEAWKWHLTACRKGAPGAYAGVIDVYLWGLGAERDRDRAITACLAGAERGKAEAQLALGEIYRSEPERDYDRALYWYQRAAKSGTVVNQYALALFLMCEEPKQFGEALEWFERASSHEESRHPRVARTVRAARACAGYIYLYGLAGPRNTEKGLRYLKEAAGGGDAGAAFQLGRCYLEGRGVKQDSVQAARWFERFCDRLVNRPPGKPLPLRAFQRLQEQFCVSREEVEGQLGELAAAAAKQGSPRAQMFLGYIALKGEGAGGLQTPAVRHLEVAAQKGLVDAQILVAEEYLRAGHITEAEHWLRKVAQNKREPLASRYAEALINYHGIGTQKDVNRAAELLQHISKTPQGGYVRALYMLGQMHERGEKPLEKNPEKALFYYLAAHESLIGACIKAADGYDSGLSGQRNPYMALKLYRLAWLWGSDSKSKAKYESLLDELRLRSEMPSP